MMRRLLYEDYRPELERQAGSFTDEQWDFLVNDGIVPGDVDANPNEAIERIQRLKAAWGASPPKRRRFQMMVATKRLAPEPADPWHPPQAASGAAVLRRESVSLLLAEDAAELEEVQSFREGVLGSRLLGLDQLENWIQEQMPDKPISVGDPKSVTLRYGTHHDDFERVAFVQRDSTLAELRWIARMLAESYGWGESQATVFVLTGLVPLVLRVGLEWKAVRPPSRESPDIDHPTAGERITLTVDPTITPSELRAIYANYRRQLLGPRHQPVREKHARLATYTSSGWKKSSWADRMGRWNDAFPQWKYRHLSNFKRDCLKARTRLLYPIQFGRKGA